MNEDDFVIRKLRDDLVLFIGELAKIESLSDGQSIALLACEQYFSDLPERLRSAIMDSHCAFVERKVGDQWRYLLQYGDFMVCDDVPARMRNTILKPILQYLTPLGNPNEIIWYCMS